MVIAACLKFLNTPEDHRIVTKKDVYANIEMEREKKAEMNQMPTVRPTESENRSNESQAPAQAEEPKKSNKKSARAFGIAKTDFSSYYC